MDRLWSMSVVLGSVTTLDAILWEGFRMIIGKAIVGLLARRCVVAVTAEVGRM